MINILRHSIPWFVAGLIAFSIGAYFRLYPLSRNVASDAHEKATILVISRLRANIAAQVTAQHPELSQNQKNALIQTEFNAMLRRDRVKVQKTFDELGRQILQTSGKEKHYLQESDSYYFLSLTQNILDTGSIGSKIKGGNYFNDLMLAPLGFWQPQTWHPYIGALTYKAVKALHPDSDLMFGVGFTPIVLLPFVIATFLLACRALSCSWLPSMIASIFFVLAPIYLKRSTYGWYDDDTYSVLFPLLILSFLILAIKAATQRMTILFSILCAMACALYARFWAGWVFFWVLAIISSGSIVIKSLVLKDGPLRKSTLILGTIFLSGMIGVVAMYGIAGTIETIIAAAGELQKFIAPRFKDWPDLFIVVGELKRSSLTDIISNTGGALMLFGGLLSCAYLLFSAYKKRALQSEHIVLLVFLGATFILGLKAQRFTLLLLTPISLFFALGIQQVWNSRGQLEKLPACRGRSSLITAAVLCAAIVIPIASSAKNISSMLTPIFNSSWDRALTALREKSPPNSIIDTWWSPGHFVKAVAQRRVCFDGANIRGDVAYWLTRVYLSPNENEALGILRMMNVSSNKAAEYLTEKKWPLSKTVPALREALKMDKENAHNFYSRIYSEKDAATLTPLTHGIPPPSYILLYHENIESNILLGYLGKWNFSRIEQLNNDPRALKQVPSRSSPKYIDFLWSIVGGPYRQSDTLAPIKQTGPQITFSDGIEIDISTMNAHINSPRFGQGIPKSIVYLKDGVITEKPLANSNLTFSVVFFQDKNAPRCILMDSELANSLLVKLYCFNGAGLKHFKPFANEADMTGRTKVLIFEVLWPKEFLQK